MTQALDPRRADTTYSQAVAEAQAYTDWLLELFDATIDDPVLEIGVGHGSYTERLHRRPGYCGIDLDPVAVKAAAERFSQARFATTDIADRATTRPLGEGTFATILCLNVLEHVPDHRAAIENLLALLRPRGRLCLFVPAHPALYNDMDRLAGHERRYTRDAIAAVVEGLPGRIVRADYVNPVGGLGWWANRSVRHDDLNGPAADRQIRLFMRYLFPVSKALTFVTRGFFGQSLVVEIEKT